MPCDIRRIGWADILSDVAWPELLAEYAAECSIPEVGKPDPQPELYALMERTGIMQCFGAYVDGALAGVVEVHTFPVPHYGKRIANIGSLFVAKDHRKSRIWLKLLRTAREHGREQRCVTIHYNAPVGSAFERVLNARKKCRRTTSVFCEVL